MYVKLFGMVFLLQSICTNNKHAYNNHKHIRACFPFARMTFNGCSDGYYNSFALKFVWRENVIKTIYRLIYLSLVASMSLTHTQISSFNCQLKHHYWFVHAKCKVQPKNIFSLLLMACLCQC